MWPRDLVIKDGSDNAHGPLEIAPTDDPVNSLRGRVGWLDFSDKDVAECVRVSCEACQLTYLKCNKTCSAQHEAQPTRCRLLPKPDAAAVKHRSDK